MKFISITFAVLLNSAFSFGAGIPEMKCRLMPIQPHGYGVPPKGDRRVLIENSLTTGAVADKKLKKILGTPGYRALKEATIEGVDLGPAVYLRTSKQVITNVNPCVGTYSADLVWYCALKGDRCVATCEVSRTGKSCL